MRLNAKHVDWIGRSKLASNENVVALPKSPADLKKFKDTK